VACSRRLSMAELPVKARVGIEMLAEAREGDFGAAHAVLLKLLGNIVAHPDELKYRRLRTTNAKIAALLQTRGVRALLIGLGFVEEGADSLVMPEAASTSVVQTGLTALDALAVQRLEAENVTKQTEMQQRAEKAKEQNEKRKLMKMQVHRPPCSAASVNGPMMRPIHSHVSHVVSDSVFTRPCLTFGGLTRYSFGSADRRRCCVKEGAGLEGQGGRHQGWP